MINIGLLFGSVLLFFGGIEGALRLTGLEKGHPLPPPIYQNSPQQEIGYALKPNMREHAFRSTVQTNSLGFRSQELDPEKPTVAVLGDSITFGYGIENDETIPAHLNTLLENRFNILNTAVPGYGLGQEIATYKISIAPLHPTTVILIFHWNDLEYQEPASLDTNGNLVPRGTPFMGHTCRPIEAGMLGKIPGRCWLDLHSAFYRVIKKIVSRRTEQRNLASQEIAYRASGFTESVKDEELEEYRKTLQAFARTLPRALPRLFVIWPEKELHLIARQKLEAIAVAQGFRVLDLYEVFGNTPQTLSWDTVHPNAETAADAAQVIADALIFYSMLHE